MMKCFYCNKIIKEGNPYALNGIHMDHIYPKSIFPELENFDLNIVPCCADCNRRKNKKFPDQWFYKLQELNILEKEDLDRIAWRIHNILYEGIKQGYITFDSAPFLVATYLKEKRVGIAMEWIERLDEAGIMPTGADHGAR